MKPFVDAVTVHYTGALYLHRCVDALQQAVGQGLTISIVDNDAPEPIPDEVVEREGVVVTTPGENLGFARGANLGAGVGDAPYILFINPDILLSRGAFQALHGFLEARPRTAACAPALIDADGEPQVGSAGCLPSVATVARQAFPLARLLGRGHDRALFLAANNSASGDEHLPVDWLSGGCLLIRRSAFGQVGGFDERFFLYGEDIDLGKRLGEQGWELACLHGVGVPHRDLPAAEDSVRRAPEGAWLDGLDLYYRLHGPRTRRVLHAIAAAGFAARVVAYARRPMHRRRMLAFMRRSTRLAVSP